MPEMNLPIERLAVRPDRAAAMIDVSPSKMQRLMNEGLVEVSKEGGTTLVIVASLRRFLADNRLKPRLAPSPAPAPRPPLPGDRRRGRPPKALSAATTRDTAEATGTT